MRVRGGFCGFTLVEIILTLVILGLVGMVGVSFFNSGVTRTDVAINQLQADAKLQLVLENMIQDANSYVVNNNLTGFYDKLTAGVDGSTGLSSTYGEGGGGYYYIANKQFVCPNTTTYSFERAATAKQFLLVTIKPNSISGVSLTYIFGTNNNSSNSNLCGS